ncbi:MAG: hypothetical protein ACI9YB_001517 [Halioglobus sp.]|jgi:hypothetical protein
MAIPITVQCCIKALDVLPVADRLWHDYSNIRNSRENLSRREVVDICARSVFLVSTAVNLGGPGFLLKESYKFGASHVELFSSSLQRITWCFRKREAGELSKADFVSVVVSLCKHSGIIGSHCISDRVSEYPISQRVFSALSVSDTLAIAGLKLYKYKILYVDWRGSPEESYEGSINGI